MTDSPLQPKPLGLSLTNPKQTAETLGQVIGMARGIQQAVLNAQPKGGGGVLTVSMPPGQIIQLADTLDKVAFFAARACEVANRAAAIGDPCYRALKAITEEAKWEADIALSGLDSFTVAGLPTSEHTVEELLANAKAAVKAVDDWAAGARQPPETGTPE